MAFLWPIVGWAQECDHFVSGKVIDSESGEAIPYASIFIEGTGQGTVSDEDGSFVLTHLCKCKFVIAVSYLGYQSYIDSIQVEAVNQLVIRLQASSQELLGVNVMAKASSAASRQTQLLSKQEIVEEADENLGNLLDAMPGVNTLKSGGGVSKPVVQGLYGNRLTILNNGIPQSGQQWGNDHSPEIDPLVASRIRILGGVEAMQYQGNSLGSMVLVEPESISGEKKLNGRAGYYFESNGLGNGVNIQMEQSAPSIAWKVNGTLKKRGDQQAANYYLTNTGIEEGNIAIQLEKSFGDKWNWEAYLSSFNSQIGVLRGSHIGNLSDLEEALQRDVPFYTKDYFSYSINAPRQTVQHNLAKINGRWLINEERWISFLYAFQGNNRKEFDVRKGGRSDIPAMSIKQLSHYLESKYVTMFNNWLVKTGTQFQYIDNTNNPETGILPLIPDYNSFETGVFVTARQQINRWQLEVGGRYDYTNQNVAAISVSVPREIIRYANHFNNAKVGLDARYFWTPKIQLSGGINMTSRSPEINELYSNGLHQGVGGIEEGDPDLEQEVAIKTNWVINASVSKKLQFEAAIYYQYIDNYIFLNPQDEIRLTIRGAFPVFKYEQTNAHIYGMDMSGHFHFSEQFTLSSQYSYIRGHGLSDDLPLINMPSNNVRTWLRYNRSQIGFANNVVLELNHHHVFCQKHLLPEQDYVLPPNAYDLIGIKLSAENKINDTQLRYYLKVDNLLNVAYRDYMNGMRYFADDLGRNIVVGAIITF